MSSEDQSEPSCALCQENHLFTRKIGDLTQLKNFIKARCEKVQDTDIICSVCHRKAEKAKRREDRQASQLSSSKASSVSSKDSTDDLINRTPLHENFRNRRSISRSQSSSRNLALLSNVLAASHRSSQNISSQEFAVPEATSTQKSPEIPQRRSQPVPEVESGDDFGALIRKLPHRESNMLKRMRENDSNSSPQQSKKRPTTVPYLRYSSSSNDSSTQQNPTAANNSPRTPFANISSREAIPSGNDAVRSPDADTDEEYEEDDEDRNASRMLQEMQARRLEQLPVRLPENRRFTGG